MLKTLELHDGNSCFNKALPNEMVFALLARDPVAAAVVRFWADERVRKGLNKPDDEQITDALDCADYMDGQRDEIRAVVKAAA